jgi:GNAT superfamily N-acetyltransferase
MAFTVRPLTPDLWPALEDLFGRAGASNGCWCMYWRIGRAYARRPRQENRTDFQAVVETGPPPGLVAFDGEIAVGWCQVTPRSALPQLEKSRSLNSAAETGAWAISCLFVRRRRRREGVTAALIDAAVETARAGGAPAIEAFPLDMTAPKGTSNPFMGIASTFARAGFKEVGRRPPARVIMRLDLAPASPAA